MTALGVAAIFLTTLLPTQTDMAGVFRVLLGVFVLLAGMGLALYWTLLAFKLHYYLSRNGLAIQWGFARQLIPFERIEAIVPGRDLAAVPTFRGLNIAGLRFGWGNVAGYGRLKFHTTAALSDSLLVVTSEQAYVISPRRPDRFIQGWQARQTLGPTQDWEGGVQRNWPFNIPIVADSLTWWLLGLGLLICLALFGYLSLLFSGLPYTVPVHFNALGHPDRTTNRADLFWLPLAGGGALLLNALLGGLTYRHEKLAAYFLWGGAVLMQLCLWVAILTIQAAATATP
jgi:hypothetical protein